MLDTTSDTGTGTGTGTGMVEDFDRMPTVGGVPADYAVEMPSFLARMAMEHGPVFRRPTPPDLQAVLGPWVVLMVGPEANRFVLQSHRHAFSHERGWTPILAGVFEQGILNTDGAAHDHDRKMMNPAFAVAYMNTYLPIMDRVIAGRTRDWAARGTVDLYEETRKITFDVAAEALVGIRAGPEVDRLRDLFYQLLYADFDAAASIEEFYTRLAAVRRELDAMLLGLIARRRAAPTGDILGLLAQARDEEDKPFSDTDLLGQLHILLVAGHETTTTLSAWLLYLLATHPGYLGRVREELDGALAEADGEVTLKALRATRALGHAIDEAGRLRSPVGYAPRGTVEDVVFGGYRIPAGTAVRLALAAGHRLPRVFADPDRFDPDRFAPPREEDKRTPYGLVTFGGGPRVCIGMSFAQLEIKAMAMRILRAYTLAPVEDRPIVHAYYSVVASLPDGLHVHVTPRDQ